MMYVDSKVCIGCGSCIQDCVVGDIQMVDGKAVMKQEACFDCGHCLAICPVDAVVSDHNQEDVREYVAEEFEIDPQRLLNFMEFRRSIRFFQNKPIEREKSADARGSRKIRPNWRQQSAGILLSSGRKAGRIAAFGAE